MAKPFDASKARQNVQPLSSRSPSEDPVVRQISPQSMRSDNHSPTPESKEDAPPDQAPLNKVYNSVLPWMAAEFHDSKLTSILKMNKTIGPVWILLLLTTTAFITSLSLLASYKTQAASRMGSYEHLVMPVSTILPQPSFLPVTESSIGAAQSVIGTYFSTSASGLLQTKVVYHGENGQICIQTQWLNDSSNFQCLDRANPRSDSPLTVLDWLGGPSIYFITTDNYLSGIDYIPLNDTWKLSTLRAQNRLTHPRSQLSSVTWFNGTSFWLYYQDINSQLREFGLDDYRDIVWRDGSIGPLGPALTGTGIGTARWWLSDGMEVLEVFVQVSGGALHGRVYMESVWTSDFYAVDGTPNTVSAGGWFYCPFCNNQRREFGVDNYRNIARRDGNIGSSTNISTVVDLLDIYGISWAEYQQDMPYTWYTGFNFTNQQNTSQNDYVWKHNPPILYSTELRASRMLHRTNESAFSMLSFAAGYAEHIGNSDVYPDNDIWSTISGSDLQWMFHSISGVNMQSERFL